MTQTENSQIAESVESADAVSSPLSAPAASTSASSAWTDVDDFRFYVPCSFFEKADAPEGKRKRVRGVVSDERKDREDEVIWQKGLEWDEFLTHGFFNDNHSKSQFDVLAYPEFVQHFAKGERLPDGKVAPYDSTWAEGYMVEGYEPAERAWALGKALAKTGHRTLGFSIEGKVRRRAGFDGKIIAKARVKHTAITHVPVNPGTYLDAFAKSFAKASLSTFSPHEIGALRLARAMTEAAAPHEDALARAFADTKTADALERAVRDGLDEVFRRTATTASAGAVIPQSLESRLHNTTYGPAFESSRQTHDSGPPDHASGRKLTKSEAVKIVLNRFPKATCMTAGRIVDAVMERRI